MLRFTTLFALTACLAAGVSIPASSADDKKTDNKAPNAKAKRFESKATTVELARAINFTEALGLHFDSLTTIGIRIDDARKTRDPVAMANAASYLAAAEAVSGKKAKLTAEELTKEAVKIARLRNKSHELKAVAMLLKDSDLVKDFPELAKKSQKREDARIAAYKAGERQLGIVGRFEMQNNTDYKIHVWADTSSGSVDLGWWDPRSTSYSNTQIEDRGDPQAEPPTTHLHAQSEDGSRNWDQDIPWETNDYCWCLDN
jgi:hypothetical protein